MNKYRTLDAWNHSHSVVLTTLRATARGTRDHWAVFDQLRRAAVSIEAIIVELGYMPEEVSASIEKELNATGACLVGLIRKGIAHKT